MDSSQARLNLVREFPPILAVPKSVEEVEGGYPMKKLAIFSGLFLIAAGLSSAASITVTSPGVDNDWVKGQARPVRWTSVGAVPAQVTIQLRNAASTAVIMAIVNPTENDGEFWWTIPGSVTPGKYRIRVKAIGADIFGDSPLLTISPVMIMTVTQPEPGAKWAKGKTHSITWTKTGPVPGKVSIFLYQNGNRTTIASCIANDGSYSWAIPMSVPAGKYQVELMAVNPQCQITDPHASSAFFWITLLMLPEAKAEKK